MGTGERTCSFALVGRPSKAIGAGEAAVGCGRYLLVVRWCFTALVVWLKSAGGEVANVVRDRRADALLEVEARWVFQPCGPCVRRQSLPSCQRVGGAVFRKSDGKALLALQASKPTPRARG